MKILTKSCSILLPLVFIIVFLIVSCENQPNGPTNENTISGVLVDEQGTGVASAIITVYQAANLSAKEIAKATTDENGKFTLLKIPSDISNLNVKIMHPDFKPMDEKLSGFKSKTSAPIILCHEDTCKGILNIWTFKQNDSSKLSEVEIRMYRGGTLIRKGLTQYGKISFTNVCPGDYVLQFSKYHYSVLHDSLSVSGSDTLNLHEYLVQTTPDSCCNGKIVISVKDSSSNSPLSGVKAYLNQGNTYVTASYSDNSGNIIFTGICPGDYTVGLNKSGYSSKYLNFHLNCNDSTGAETFLTVSHSSDSCCDGVLKLFLIDKSTGKPPSNKVTVNLTQYGKVVTSQTVTSYAYFTKICKGTYQITINSSYYETLSFDYTSNCNAHDTMTKHLVPTHTGDSCCHGIIGIIFKDASSKALLKGISVYLYLGGTKVGAMSTDINGAVHFTGICNGDYTVKASLSGYDSYQFTLTMGCNDTNTSTQYLTKTPSTDTCCTAKLFVTVLDSTDGTPIAGATVYIIKTDGTVITGTTDSTGYYSAEGLCAPVTYKVKAVKSGYNYNYVPITFKQCDTQHVTLKIKQS